MDNSAASLNHACDEKETLGSYRSSVTQSHKLFMSGLTDNTQLGAAGSKRDLSPASHSKMIQVFCKKRSKVCKRNQSKESGKVVGMKYCTQVAGETQREIYSISQDKVFPG